MALIQASFDGFFLRISQALQPYRGHVVFIGGCANVLYRYHPVANRAAMKPLTTFDHVNAVGIQEALDVAKENGILVTADMIHPAIDNVLVAIESGLPSTRVTP